MLDRRTFLGASAAALLARPLRAVAAPITISQAGLVFLAISVNGRAAKALVDTGSVRGLQLSQAFTASAGLVLAATGRSTQRYQGGAREVLATRAATLDFGAARLTDIEASVAPGDIEAIGGQIGEAFDAILGWPLLSRQAFTIDYRAGSLDFGDGGPATGLSLPLERGRPLPVTPGSLSGQPLTFLVDTGAPWCNVDRSLVADAAPNSRVELPFEIGGRHFTTIFRVKDLGAMTRGLGARAVIGHRFLQGFRFQWRPASSAIRLAPPTP